MDAASWDGVLLAFAAVGAAAIAAWTANHRMERQLTEETGRLERQLAHDREMRDREELRRTLDEAAGTYSVAGEEAAQLLNLGHRRTEGEGEDEYRRHYLSARDKAHSAFIQKERLQFRFGDDDLAAEFTSAFNKMSDALTALEPGPSAAALDSADELLDEAVGHYLEFSKLCRPYVDVIKIRPG
jgi:hypothetical protein